MSLNTARSRLRRAHADLRVHWDTVHAGWNDTMSAKFEKRYLADLETRIQTAVAALERLEDVLHRMDRECR